MVKFENFLIIGISDLNGVEVGDADLAATKLKHANATPFHRNQKWKPKGTKGLITPHTDGFIAKNIRMHKFYAGMTLIETCSECYHFKKWNNGGSEYNIEELYVDPTTT